MATSTGTQVPANAKGPFPPFASETFASQILWLVLIFVALYLLMSRVALPRVGGILEARKARIAGDLAAAERLKADSDAAIAAYEKSLSDARAQAQASANAVHAQQQAAAEENRKVLEAQLNARIAEAEKTIAATRSAAMGNVQSIAADAASAIVARLIGTAPASAAVDAAVADVLKR